jgi:hypothetical protein
MAIAFPAIFEVEYRAREKVGMRRRKATTLQVNVRLDTMVVDELEARARANRVSFSEEARQRLIDSLNPKPELGLAGALDDFKRQMRDAIESGARQNEEDIEEAWRVLRRLDALSAKFYGDIENELSPYVRHAQVRTLLRGAPVALPDEAKAKSKATQQE